MALTLDNTLSGTSANSYVDVTYADAYWTNHWNTANAASWNALSPSVKPTLLIHACRVIETVRFTNFAPISEYSLHYDRITRTLSEITLSREPVKYYYYQKLQFPRNLDINPTLGGFYIPEPVMMAQCEQAVFMLNFDDSAIADRMQGVTEQTIALGKSQIHVAQKLTADGTFLAPIALQFLEEFMIRGGRIRRS